MALTPTDAAPSAVVQGDAHQWRVAASGYASTDGYTATVRYIGTSTSVTGTATADGDTWIVDLTPALSATLPGGRVTWRLTVAKTGEQTTLATGSFQCEAVPQIGAGATAISHNEEMLSLWQARAKEQAGNLLQEYEVGGTRRAKKYTLKEVRENIAFYRSAVLRERNGGRLPATAVVFTSGC